MSRQGLIFPVLAEIAPFVGATQQDADFNEPARFGAELGGPGSVAPAHGPTYTLPCQVETEANQVTSMQSNGDDPTTRLHLVFAHRSQGDGKGAPMPRDRLVALRSLKGELLQTFEGGEDIRATETRPMSFGLFRGRTKFNLQRVTFQSRASAARRLS